MNKKIKKSKKYKIRKMLRKKKQKLDGAYLWMSHRSKQNEKTEKI